MNFNAANRRTRISRSIIASSNDGTISRIIAHYSKIAVGGISRELQNRDINISSKWTRTAATTFFRRRFQSGPLQKKSGNVDFPCRRHYPYICCFTFNRCYRRCRHIESESLVLYSGVMGQSRGEFWSAFLFETPFVLFRGFLWMLPPVMAVLYSIFAARASRHYQNAKKVKPLLSRISSPCRTSEAGERATGAASYGHRLWPR